MGRRQIAKNTFFLYVRILVTIVVSLYTSRVILQVLGAEDFGIYNVVGGIVVMFSFLNAAMATATQRFLTFEIGRNNRNEIQRIFSMSLIIYVLMALVIFVLGESVGLYLFYQLNIPGERLDAALITYHITIFTFIFSVVRIPFHALIIAKEKMGVYAIICIIETFSRLGILYVIQMIQFDSLVLYAFFLLLISILITLVYVRYCRVHYIESKYILFWDRQMFFMLTSYAGWNLFGNIAFIAATQGINIVLNVFFGPIVNAARGVAFQVQAAVKNFVANFQLAVDPQIIKSYANNELNYCNDLIYSASKYSFFLLYLLSVPLLYRIEYIMELWLENVPEYTVIFCKLILVNALIDAVSGPLSTSAQATGKIKLYQFIVGSVLLLNLPIAYLVLYWGGSPQSTVYVSIIISIVLILLRVFILDKFLHVIKISRFIYRVILPVFAVVFPTLLILSFLVRYVPDGTLGGMVLVLLMTAIVNLVVIFLTGLSISEKRFVIQSIQSVLKKNM